MRGYVYMRYAFIYMYMKERVCIYVLLCYIHIYERACMYVYERAYMYVYERSYMFIYIYMYIYI